MTVGAPWKRIMEFTVPMLIGNLAQQLYNTGVVVDGHDVDVRVPLLDGLHHALAADMVGQAPEGLGADDVPHALVRQLQHFRRKEPPLAHLDAHADGPLRGRRAAGGRDPRVTWPAKNTVPSGGRYFSVVFWTALCYDTIRFKMEGNDFVKLKELFSAHDMTVL